MKIILSAALAAAACLALPAQAFAYDWSMIGRVTFIEGTYAPNVLPFKIDGGTGNCPAGNLLYWNPQGPDSTAKASNYNAILAILLTAKTTKQYVNLFGNNNGCTIDYLYIQ